jgi:hypothetical protein
MAYNKNYLSNSFIEGSRSAWVGYVGDAVAFPQNIVIGDGGLLGDPPLVTTTNPLSGLASLQYYKVPTSILGEGFCAPFRIDSIDQGRMFTFNYDCRLVSGTYNEGTQTTPSSLTVYIYDVTNNRILNQPAQYRIMPGAAGVGATGQVEFQTAINSRDYLVCIHVSTVSGADFTINFDNMVVERSNITRGALITDPVSYTPTFTGLGTVTAASVSWYREGRFLMGTGTVTTGTVTAANVSLTLPAGLTIDSSLPLSSTGYAIVGQWARNATSALANSVIAPNSGNVVFASLYGGGTRGAITPAFGTDFGSTESQTFRFSVPIAGWSSSQQLSSDAGLRSVVFRASTSTARTINNTSPTIIYETISKDTVGGYNTSTGEYTVRESGDYKFGAAYRTIAHTSTVSNVRAVLLFRNGTQISNFAAFRSQITGSIVYQSSGSDTQFFNAGDIITWRIYSDDATTLAASTPLDNYIYLEKLSSPQQLAASEKIFFQARKSSAQSIPNNTQTTVTNWTNTDIDSTGSFNATTGVYTVSRAGVARIETNIGWVGNATGVRQGIIVFNGTAVAVKELPGSTVANTNCDPAYLTPVKAGDLIRVDVFQGSGGALNTASSASQMIFSIEIT